MSRWIVCLAAVVGVDSLSGCDPIDPARCYLPFPNNFWLRNEHLAMTTDALPKDTTKSTIDPDVMGINELDGFPGLMPLTTYFKGLDLASSDTPPYWDIGKSLSNSSCTVILDTRTGQRVAHWSELDDSSGQASKPSEEAMFMIWPAKRLDYSTRYIVAMRGLADAQGQLLTPSPAFASLRDGTTSDDPDVNERRALFEDIFQRLAQSGVDRESLQLAWDFTTGSRESITGRLLHMRDDGLGRLAELKTPAYHVRKVTDNVSASIAREIEVEIQVAQYTNTPFPGARLVLDASGTPVFQGFHGAMATILVPKSVASGVIGMQDASILQYGHGLFGSRGECKSGYLTDEANRFGYVIIASDWIGLCQTDVPSVALMLTRNISNFGIIPDRTQQGMLRAFSLMRLLQSPKFLADAAMTFDGRAILTPTSPRYYFGNSEGGIFGSVYMATSLDVTRGVIGVGGGPYSLLLPRSHDFVGPLWTDLKLRYLDTLDRIFLLSLLQLLWDRADPGGYQSAVCADPSPLPNTPGHSVIFHHGLGDAQVTFLGTYTSARSVNASIFASNVHEEGDDNALWGFPVLPDSAASHGGCVMVSWDFPGVPKAPRTNIPAGDDTDTHEGPRRQTDAQDMMHHFFLTGDIINTCGGPCHGVHNFSASSTSVN